MSLNKLIDTRPSSHLLDTSLSPSYGCSTIGTFSSGVRYIQRALLGFDSSTSYASLTVTSFGRLSLTEPRCDINYLPVELLREIFILICLPYETSTHPLNASDPRTPYPPRQLVLGQVCSYWRRVTLSFPELWSTIIIISPTLHHFPMAKLWLERSGQLPLTLYINNKTCFTYDDVCISTTIIEDVINLLRPHVCRWKSFTLRLSGHPNPSTGALPAGYPSLFESLLDLPSEFFSSLEIVHIDVGRYFEGWYPESVRQIGEMFLPSFSQLKIFEWKAGNCPHLPFFPENLTHLSGDFALDTPFFSSLSELKNLQCLRLNGTHRWSDHLSRQLPLTLHHLHTLDLRTEKFPPLLLNAIVTPNLEVLVIGTRLTEEDYDALPLFLASSSCNLKAFSYFNSTGESSELRFWKDLFSSPHVHLLSELNVKSRNADALLTVLSWTNPDRPVLPSLDRLWLRTRWCSVGHLFDMIKYRVHHFQPPSSPALSEGLFDGVPCPGIISFSSAERSLSIETDCLQNNDSCTLAELNKSIERYACGHRKIIVPLSTKTMWY